MSSDEYPEEEIDELRGGLILEQEFDSDNSLFEEEEFSAAFARTLFVTAQTLFVTTPEITTTATTIMNNVTTFLGSGNTICQADRTPQELSTESKLYPKENRADLNAMMPNPIIAWSRNRAPAWTLSSAYLSPLLKHLALRN